MTSHVFQARVADVRQLTDDAVEIELLPVAGSDTIQPRAAGQHIAVRLPSAPSDRRTYSLTTSPDEPLRIGVREVPGGAVSQALVRTVQVGDTIECMQPGGRFTFVPDAQASRHILLVGAGSGITPLLSIAREALRAEPASFVTLLYTNRTVASTMFRDELDDLKARYPQRISVHHFLTREQRDLDLFDGRLTGERLTRIWPLVAAGGVPALAYLCGPEAMTNELRATLVQFGLPAETVKVELFEAADGVRIDPERIEQLRAAEQSGHPVSVRINGITTTVPIPDGATVLEGALAAGLDVPFACAGGVCATCRAHVDSGEVVMRRNQALTDDEVADGFVLTCQAEVSSDSAAIDFDR